MLTSAKTQRFTQIVVIESLADGDLHTGRQIHEDLLTLKVAYSRPFDIKYVKVTNSPELFSALATVLQDTKANGHRPILHFECHGSDDEKGMVLADDSYVSWVDLKPILTDINIGCRCGLLILLSMCNGGCLVDIVSLIERAPCWGLIGPMKPVSAGNLLQGFAAFYRVLFSTLDGDLAIKELFRLSPNTPYVFIPAEGFFRRAYSGYLRNYTTPDAYNARARKLSRMIRKTNPNGVGVGAMKRILKKNEKVAFEKFRGHFFMADLFPENDDRFDASYTTIRALAAEVRQ